MSDASFVNCSGKTVFDCLQCQRYYSSHSLHEVVGRSDKISSISCSIGGNRDFNEEGDLVK
jgi:transcription elongation factor Elf1